MGVMRELLRYWAPIVAFVVVAIVAAAIAIRFYNEFDAQYTIAVSKRDDAVARVLRLCSDAQQIVETNYGSTCRQYQHDSQVNPLWAAIAATADSYRLCDAKTGCGAGVVILGMLFAGMGTALYIMFKLTINYNGYLRGFNDHYDDNFMFGGANHDVHFQRGALNHHRNDPGKID